MRTVQLNCSRCHAPLTMDQVSSSISCPYCGSTGMLVESDRVKTAQIQADTERLSMMFDYKEHLDFMSERRFRHKAQIVIICIFSVIALVFTWLLLAGSPGDFLH